MPDPKLSRRRFLQLAATALATALAGRGFWNSYQLQHSHHERQLTKLRQPLRLVQCSDAHLGPLMGLTSLRHWVAITNAERPDLIVITGDLIDKGLRQFSEAMLAELASLAAPLGVYAVLGNHEHGSVLSLTSFQAQLAEAGIEVLTNRGLSLRPDLYLAGIDDWRRGRPNLAAALRARQPEQACILLSHNPDVLPHLAEPLDLVLCGHTHGGQVVLPWLGAPYVPSSYGRRFVSGWVEASSLAYVSRGIGVSTLPLRFNCPPELVSMLLLPA